MWKRKFEEKVEDDAGEEEHSSGELKKN